MSSASSLSLPLDSALSSARFWSKSLKELVSVRKVQMVMEGMTIGILILNSVCSGVAPSMDAASIRSSGMLCRPAM